MNFLEKLNCTFEALDTDKNGRLSVQELKQGLTTLGLSEDQSVSMFGMSGPGLACLFCRK